MDVYKLVASYRIKLLRRDAGAQRELQVAYDQAFKAINEELTNTARQLEASGPGASPALLQQHGRLKDLQDQVSEAMSDLGHKAGNIATREQRLSVTAARDEAVQLIESKAARVAVRAGASAQVTGVFNRLPSDVIAELVGVSAKGTPVRIVFEGIARDLGLSTSERITKALVQGVSLGWHPDRIARQVRREADAKGGNPMRSPAVVSRLHGAVRNEMLRAYRETTRATYQENDNVVKKWRWVSRQSPSTCVVCWSQDGRTFPLSTPFASHPHCLCVQTPVLDGEREKYITGPERFETLEESVQREILGDKAFDAFAAGELEEIEQLVRLVQSNKWGPSRTRVSLEEALRR
jgi:hypothetical protein